MDNVFADLYFQIQNNLSTLKPVERVVSMKEAAAILDIPERTLRSRLNNGEFSEEEGEFRRMGATIVFDREAIEARRFMKKEIYRELKAKYNKD